MDYTFNFDERIDRRGSGCYKWDEVEDGVLPLWVADMDFAAAPCIQAALRRRLEHGVFGYALVPDSYYESIINWFSRRHGWSIQRDWILYVPGVVPAVSAIIKAMTKPGDKVLIQTPVYNCFFSSIRNNGCAIVENPLGYADDTYTIDFEDFERKVADPAVKVFLLCNPHNPCGRVWTTEELRRMGELCLQYGVFVISDEIHCEIVSLGYSYTPYGSISDELLLNSAICTSPSKAFNIAGLQNANITIADPRIRVLVNKAININEVCDVNPLGVVAVQAAYNEGESWLDEVNRYIFGNYLALCDYVKKELASVSVCKLEGTYLAWLRVRGNVPSAELAEVLESRYKLKLSAGQIYGTETGRDFLRLNLACPRSVLLEALDRLKRGLDEILPL